MPAPAARVKTAYHHSNLREAVLEVALRLITQRGGAHFTLREVASAVGVTHPSVYRHFADRSALLDALTSQGFEKLSQYQADELARAAQNPAAGPLAELVALGIAYVRFALENRGFFALLFSARLDETAADSGRDRHSEQVMERLIAAIRACQDQGIVIAGDPRLMAGFLIMAPHGFAHYVAQNHTPKVPANLMPIFPSPETLAQLDLIPLLVNPPSPSDVASLYFGAAPAPSV